VSDNFLILLISSNIAEQMIEKGLATVLRHKRDDEDRSAELDKLIVAEQT
jgi:staphylococcal nuclease domain-containing protein 1